MKTTKDEKGVIHYHYNIFDRIYIWIMNRTIWKLKSWFFHTRFGDWFWREILWGKFGIKPYHRPNDFQEATFYLYVQIEREAEKKRLMKLKEEMGEEKLLKMLKKKLKRKDFKKTMERINRWKEKGVW